MRESFPTVTVEDSLRVVEDDYVITSAGVSAGMDMALRVVARYYGEGIARAPARRMEYCYPGDDSRRGSPRVCRTLQAQEGDIVNRKIRPFSDPDLDSVLDIAVAAWTPVFASFRRTMGPCIFETVCRDWQTEKIRQVQSACRGEHGAAVLVVELDGEVVAFISYYLNRQTGIGEIGNNAVHPHHQGAGIGTMMYEHVIGKMREAGMRCAKVSTGGDPSHAPARRAYEKAGFSVSLPGVDYYKEL